MPIRRTYGWRPDRPDDRDYLLHEHVRLPAADTLPPVVDLRATGFLADPIFDQGQLGSCTANAIASAVMYVQRASKLSAHVTPARLAIYYWERVLEGAPDEDAGAELRDGLKVVAGKPGYVDEAEWPYDTRRFAVAPTRTVVADAARDRVTRYLRMPVGRDSMRQALAAGFPVVVGFSVFDAIESAEVARTGMLPMPRLGERPIGGHAVLLVGYDDRAQVWICRNSWGEDWGAAGYFSVPYGYLDSPAYGSDFWVIQQEVEGDPAPPPAPTDPLHELVAWLRAWLARHNL